MSETPPQPCPPEAQLLDFLDGGLADPERAALLEHLGGCPLCAAVLVEASEAPQAGAFDQTQQPARPGHPEDHPAAIDGRRSASLRAIGEYRLLGPLGRGAMGQVFVGHDTWLDRPVAVKFLRHAPDQAARERFLTEARAIARLSHPNVVAVYRAGEVAGQPYLITELVRGKSLAELALPLPWDQAVQIGVGLCRGLAAAHGRGVLHRDLKPANAMLALDGTVKLLDFGLAKLSATHPDTQPPHRMIGPGSDPGLTPSLTSDGTVIGTPLYLAPEGWRGEPATPAADVYSMGALLYELCAGQPPHRDTTLAALSRRVQEQDAPPLTGVPEVLAQMVASCLHRSPGERPASAAELCRELERLLPPSVSDRLEAAAADWARLGLSAQVLWNEPQLREVAHADPQQLPPLAAVFLQESRRRVSRRRLALRGVAAAGLVTCLLLLCQRQRAADDDRQQADSLRQAERAAQIGDLVQRPGQEVSALVLAVEAVGVLLRTGDLQQRGSIPWQLGAGLNGALLATQRSLPLHGHRGEVLAVALSPDGERVVSAGEDGVALQWSTRTGAVLGTIAATSGVGPLRGVAFSPDGALLAVIGSDGAARVHDQGGGLRAVLSGHEGAVYAGRFSPDGTWLVTAGADGTARLWDTAHFSAGPVLRGHQEAVLCAAFSPDSQRVVTGGADGTARLWDVRGGPAQAVLSTRHERVRSAVFSPDGTQVLTAGADGTLRLWDAGAPGATAQQAQIRDQIREQMRDHVRAPPRVPIRVIEGHRMAVAAAEFLPDGTIVSASADGTARLWQQRTGQALAVLEGHLGPIDGLAVSRAAPLVATASLDGTVRVWDLRRRARELQGGGTAVSFSADGAAVLAAGEHEARTYATATGAPLLTLGGHRSVVQDAALLARSVVTIEQDGTLSLYDRGTGALRFSLPGAATIDAAAVSPDGAVLAAAGRDGGVRLYALRDGPGAGAPGATLRAHLGPALAVAFSPDGKLLASGGKDGAVQVWDMTTRAPRERILGHSGWIAGLAFSPQGRRLASASWDSTARIWDLSGDTPVCTRVLAEHVGPLRWVGWAPEGRRLVTVGADHTARVWDVQSGAGLSIYTGHAGAFSAAAFSPDGTWLLLARAEGPLELVPAPLQLPQALELGCALLRQQPAWGLVRRTCEGVSPGPPL